MARIGYYQAAEKQCPYTMAMVSKYQKCISGPVLDRIDIHLDVPCVPMQKLASLNNGEPSVSIRQRVEKACEIQQARFALLKSPLSRLMATWSERSAEVLYVGQGEIHHDSYRG